MAELRAFIDLLRQEYGLSHPLAHEAPFVSGRQLVLRAQEEAGLDGEFCLATLWVDSRVSQQPAHPHRAIARIHRARVLGERHRRPVAAPR
jgi:hypothetical protein